MASPRILLNAHDIRADKQSGQHFLSDRSVAEMIVLRSQASAKDVVLEIGAGLGALTIPAGRVVKKLYAVEKDPRIMAVLEKEVFSNRLSNIVLIRENILQVDIKALGKGVNHGLVVLGNLPYNISSQILVKLINSREVISRAILMFQKEVANRITAPPGGREYGRLSVMLQYCANIKTLLAVRPTCFFPKPGVESMVLGIDFETPMRNAGADDAFLFRVIKAAFGKRRKTLKNALAGSEFHLDGSAAFQALDRAGIDPARRAETLSVSDFVRLSDCLKKIVGQMGA